MTNKSKYDMPAVQNFAFGGIANPVQRAMLRGSDKVYLSERQKELDAFEEQRQAYNSALTKYQTEVYNPYKAQAESYNTAAQRYNEEVYNPYKTQYDTYTKAIEDYNAGPRTEDYTGPAAPTLAREFGMTAPTAPTSFDNTAPVLPFKEEDVVARQQQAAGRARQNASDRSVAIDVVSNPDKYNFGSMSVANRFMAKGGEVTDDSRDRAASSVIKDFESYGYTKKEIMALADEVAAAGRGGDELLAYLSPESVELLKANGGAGTINPATGLPEFLFGQQPILGSASVALRDAILLDQQRQAAADKAASDAAAAAEAARLAELQKTLVMKDPGQIGKQPHRSDAFPAYFLAKEALEAQQERDRMATASAAELLRQTQERDRMIATPVIGTPKAPVAPRAQPSFQNTPQFSFATPVIETNRTPAVSIAQPSFQNTPQFSFANSPSSNFSGSASVPQFMARDSTNSYSPISAPVMPNYSSRGVGAISNIGSAAANADLSPTVLGSTQNANLLPTVLGGTRNANLSPAMLGGAQNAGFFTDRLGNRIYAPGMGYVSTQRFAKGGDVDLKALMAQNTENLSDEQPEEAINTNPVGTAQKMLADLSKAGQASPTRQSIKRVKTPSGDGATADKAMQMAYEALAKGDLSAMKDVTPGARNTDSARAQMEELARIYQMKIRATQEKAKGLSANTFGAPTLENQTLTKGRLTKKRFKDGGEAKKKYRAEGSPEEDEVKQMQNAARKNEAYQALEKYLQSRDAMPDIKINKDLYAGGVYNSDNLNIGRGTVEVNKNTSKEYRPSILAHEITHAADRQMRQQAIEQGMFGKSNQYTEAYEKLVGPEGEKRTEFVRRLNPKYAGDNRLYRASAREIPAHGVGAFVEPNQQGSDLRHLDATAATELQILLDLAQRNVNKGPTGLAKIPASIRKIGRYSKGGEVDQGAEESLDKYYAPKARPSTGLNRKEGPLSRALNSGEAYVNMAKGVTELPYDIAGAPVDLATMLMRPFGYSTEKPVMGSDFIKEKMTKLGVRPEAPVDPTAKGFYTAGELLSNLTNPAGVTRAAVKGAKKTGEAATAVAKDFQEYNRQLSVPGASYAVRPTGSMTSMNNPAVNSRLERLIADGRRGQGVERTTEGMENFWNVKARNYFEKQFGTPNDPIAEGLKTGRIKSGATQSTEAFPSFLTDQLTVGTTRTREGERPAAGFVGPGTPATRFFPKYPQAMEEFTTRYDTATGLKGDLISLERGMGNETYPNMLSPLGDTRAIQSRNSAREMLAAQGVRDELANPNIELTVRSEKDPTQFTGYSPQAKELLAAYEKSKEKPSMLSRLGITPEAKPAETLSQSVLTAIEKGEPIYDTTGIKAPLKSLFDPTKINKYLETLPERELKKVRFEDVVQGANKMFAEEDTLKTLAERIRSNKSVPDTVFSEGISSPLLQFDNKSGFEGFAWKRLETPESTVPEGAYLGHSVGGYKLGGPTYSKEKMQAFKDGRNQVYTLRDNRNRPVTTVEVQMLDEFTPAVLQIKGNGRATGNVPAENYDRLVLDFFENYLHPVQISEKDALLTPLLQQYKDGINANFKMP